MSNPWKCLFRPLDVGVTESSDATSFSQMPVPHAMSATFKIDSLGTEGRMRRPSQTAVMNSCWEFNLIRVR